MDSRVVSGGRQGQVARTYSQTFGSIGAGTAWWRVARALRTILRRVFHIPVFLYVDDLFALAPSIFSQSILYKLRWILSDLLGWPTDDNKSAAGNVNIALGAQISIGNGKVQFYVPDVKKSQWLADLTRIWCDDWLHPEIASKLAGRLQWATCRIFNRCAKAVLRPIIRRQSHRDTDCSLAKRLRQAVCWFIQLLESHISRSIEFSSLPAIFPVSLPVVYSDATGGGLSAAVIYLSPGRVFYCRHHFP